jgi:hypothetical protein
MQVAEIFSGDIDFHRALRKGDRFPSPTKPWKADGEPLRSGRVLSAEFVNGGKTFQAMWFQEPVATGSAVACQPYPARAAITRLAARACAGVSWRRPWNSRG